MIEQGQLVQIRNRFFIVQDVRGHKDSQSSKVTLECMDDDRLGDTFSVIWEREINPQVYSKIEIPDLPQPGEKWDSPGALDAFLHAVEWSSASVIEGPALSAPFRAAIDVEDFQLDPVNALVNDQLERLRLLLAGTRITFGRYTGETDQRADDTIKRLDQPRPYTADERRKMAGDGKRAPERIIPWEECFTRDEIIRRRPNLLLTNYTMLEYMLLRDRDLELLRGAPLQFFVFDEVHTYTGALGSEVACLIRRLRAVANKEPDDVICIGTSATVTDQRNSAIDGVNAIQTYCHRLFGVDKEKVELVTEQYADPVRPDDPYTPPLPEDMGTLLTAILDTARASHLQDTVDDIPDTLLALAERLCGWSAPDADSNTLRLYRLLESNRVVWELSDWFRTPRLFDDAVQGLIRLGKGRQTVERDTLRQEMLAYLTLGALAFQDEEPLLRPKLHYFIQGYQGLKISFEAGGPQLHVDGKGEETKADGTPFPLLLCRACGQHYVRLIADPEEATEDGSPGHRVTRTPDPYEEPKGDSAWLTFTDVLHTQFDDADRTATEQLVCRQCGAIHQASHGGPCLGCGALAEKALVLVLTWEGHMSQCPACGTYDRGGKDFRRTRTIIPARSRDVGDVTILSQSMLSAMPEEKLRKLLIFADNRQDAAFQAGWMEERGKRFRMRHASPAVSAPSRECSGLTHSLRTPCGAPARPRHGRRHPAQEGPRRHGG